MKTHYVRKENLAVYEIGFRFSSLVLASLFWPIHSVTTGYLIDRETID